MKITASTSAYFDCALERAFKVPILGDATDFLKGYLLIPSITHFTEDETWGRVGGSRVPHSAKSILSKAGEVGFDQILERRENEYWKWEVTDFRQASIGFSKFQGELFFEEVQKDRIFVKWKYSLYSSSILIYPVQFLFTKLLWKGNMSRALIRMKKAAESKSELLYS